MSIRTIFQEINSTNVSINVISEMNMIRINNIRDDEHNKIPIIDALFWNLFSCLDGIPKVNVILRTNEIVKLYGNYRQKLIFMYLICTLSWQR